MFPVCTRRYEFLVFLFISVIYCRYDKKSLETPPYSYNLWIKPSPSMRGFRNLDGKMSEEPKSNRGRPVVLTDCGRKRNRKEVLAKYAKTNISIGIEIDRWTVFKDDLNIGSHAEAAKVLVDR